MKKDSAGAQSFFHCVSECLELCKLKLVSQFFSDQIYFDPAGMHTSSGHDNLITEAFRRETVVADPGGSTGKISFQADCIGRRSEIAHPGYTSCYIRYDLVHTGHDDDM